MPNGVSRYPYLRAKVAIDIRDSLPKEIELEYKKVVDKVTFRYERLQSFCYWCGLMNHVFEDCQKYLDEQGTPETCPFDESMKARPTKPPRARVQQQQSSYYRPPPPSLIQEGPRQRPLYLKAREDKAQLRIKQAPLIPPGFQKEQKKADLPDISRISLGNTLTFSSILGIQSDSVDKSQQPFKAKRSNGAKGRCSATSTTKGLDFEVMCDVPEQDDRDVQKTSGKRIRSSKADEDELRDPKGFQT